MFSFTLYEKFMESKFCMYVPTSVLQAVRGGHKNKKKMFCIESSFSTDTKVNCKP